MEAAGNLSNVMLTLLTPILQALATALATALVAWVVQQARKVGLEITAQQQAQLVRLAQEQILKAEELAAQQAKSTRGVAVTPGSEKFNHAVSGVMDAMPSVKREKAETVVLSQLSGMNLGATVGVLDPPPPQVLSRIDTPLT